MFLILFCFLCSSCSKNQNVSSNIQFINYQKEISYQIKNFKKNNVDYAMILSGKIGKPNKMLVLPLSGSPKTFNTWTSQDGTSSTVSGLMYLGLFQKHPTSGEFMPALAKSYEIEDEGKKIIVKLRQNIKWSDGKPITAEDILFTWNIILKEGYERSGIREGLMIEGKFPEVYSQDPDTIIFKTHRVFAPLLSYLEYAIAPKHFFEKYLEQAKTEESKHQKFISLMGTQDNLADFVVSGPFQPVKYIKNERIEYKKNPEYIFFDRENNKLPYFEKLNYLILNNHDLEVFKFAMGDIPYLGIDNVDRLNLLKKIKIKNPFIIYKLGASDVMSFVAFNMQPKNKNSTKWFNDKNFRKALSLVIDRQAMINKIYQGAAKPSCLGFSSNSLYFNKNFNDRICLTKPQFEEARKILLEAGYSYNKNHQLLDPQNNLVQFNIFTNQADSGTKSSREFLMTIIKENWEELGLIINTKIMDFNNLGVRLSQTGDWDCIVLGFGGESLIEPNGGANVWKSDGRLHIFDQRNPSKKIYNIRPFEKEIDNLVENGTAYIEVNKRKDFYYKIQEILWEENPLIYLVTPETFLAVNKKLINFQPSKLNGLSYNLDQWFFD